MKKTLIVASVFMAGSVAFLLPGQEAPVKAPGKGKGKVGKQDPNVRPVKGAPFSAVEVTTTTQTLPEGNHILHVTRRKVYRDSEGRERAEQEPTMSILGERVPVATVMIADTVAGVTYNLDPSESAARKVQGVRLSLASVANAVTPVPNRGSVSKEQRPPDTIEGVYAQGSRTTTTIPAGQVGNEKDFNVVDETWYSPDLQMNVMTMHDDPRSGKTLYRLTNIVRAEPEASLFQVPARSTVEDPPKTEILFVTSPDRKTTIGPITIPVP